MRLSCYAPGDEAAICRNRRAGAAGDGNGRVSSAIRLPDFGDHLATGSEVLGGRPGARAKSWRTDFTNPVGASGGGRDLVLRT